METHFSADWAELERRLRHSAMARIAPTDAISEAAAGRWDRAFEDFAIRPAIPGELRQSIPSSNASQQVFHPLSGTPSNRERSTPSNRDWLQRLDSIQTGLSTDQARFLALWRHLPELTHDAGSVPPPVDPCRPDYSVVQYLDLLAALDAAGSEAGGGSLLSFQIGPVQGFVAAARSTRDLLSGSVLLSWLTHEAMVPVIATCGPAAVVFPALRGSPLFDRWLADQGLRGLALSGARNPGLPNKFLALVPESAASDLAKAVETAARQAWLTLADGVRSLLDREWHALDSNWSRLWQAQVESYFDVRVSSLSRKEWDKFDGSGPAGWPRHAQASAQLLDATRMIRQIPLYTPKCDGPVPEKCTLLGTYEQMGPGERQAAKRFWAAAGSRTSSPRIGSHERLCAISLVKRFAFAAGLDEKLGLTRADVRFPDTATVAATCWLESLVPTPDKLPGEWSGQWLHWPKHDHDPDEDAVPERTWEAIQSAKRNAGPPPTYFAVLMMDGDRMGEWIAGKRSPTLGAVLHPSVRTALERDPAKRAALNLIPRDGAARQAAISEALGNYSQRVAPSIVANHKGQLVYSGGDDLLALFPLETALAAAAELCGAFQGLSSVNGGAPEGYYRFEGRDLMMMGPKATVSAGLAIVHYKEDLRAALQAARDAESYAKGKGRNALGLGVCRRSGEHSIALCPWHMVLAIGRQVELYRGGASDRWAYQMRSVLDGGEFKDLPEAAVLSEIRRLISRSEERKKLDPDQLIQEFEALRTDLAERKLEKNAPSPIDTFVALSQSAAFLARGRDS